MTSPARETTVLRAADDPPPPKVPEASAEVLQERLDTLREEMRERPQASIYVDVKNGKARLVMPNGHIAFVREGEAIRIWPSYCWREEQG